LIDSGLRGYIRAKEDHHLAKNFLTFTINQDTVTGTLGPLIAGDGDNSNQINIMDASITKSGNQFSKADIDRDNQITDTDMRYIRNNFGAIGEPLK